MRKFRLTLISWAAGLLAMGPAVAAESGGQVQGGGAPIDMISVTAPVWVGILIGFVIGGAAELWGIANPESIIRLARLKDRLFVGCVTVGGSVAVLVLFGLYALGVDFHRSLRTSTSGASFSEG